MARGKLVTPAMVETARSLVEEHPDLTKAQVAKLCDTSVQTLNKILRGEYDGQGNAERSDDELVHAIMELSEAQKTTHGMLMAICLGLAIIVDPTCNTSQPVANLLREAARGDANAD